MCRELWRIRGGIGLLQCRAIVVEFWPSYKYPLSFSNYYYTVLCFSRNRTKKLVGGIFDDS